MPDPVRSINKQRRKLSTKVKSSLSSASNGADKNSSAVRVPPRRDELQPTIVGSKSFLQLPHYKMAQRHPIMSIEEVAEYLKLSVPTIYRMVRRGQLPGIKLGRQWRFRQVDIYNLFVQRYHQKRKTRNLIS